MSCGTPYRGALGFLVAALLLSPATGAAKPGELEFVGRYDSGIVDSAATESAAYYPGSQRLFVVNRSEESLDVIDISEPGEPALLGSLPLDRAPTSVAVSGDMIAVSVPAEPITEPGAVIVFDPLGAKTATFEAGAGPKMVAFSTDGRFLVCANEGVPSDDYQTDPPGTVTVIDLEAGIDQARVSTIGFEDFNEQSIDGIHAGRPESSNAQNFEPEFVAIASDQITAYVSLQESNAIAVLDLETPSVTDVIGLGFKDHSVIGLDANDTDEAVNIRTWPVLGLYQPDAIAAYEVEGQSYLITVNEGEVRNYDGWSEEVRVQDLSLDPEAFDDPSALQAPTQLGRLVTTSAMGDDDGDGDHERIFSFGGRSFSIRSASGELLFDSGDMFEREMAQRFPDFFNASEQRSDRDARSDDRGPEPEGVAVARIGDRTFAYIGLEQIGGVMIYDVSDPKAPSMVGYHTTRDFEGSLTIGGAGDISPESLIAVDASESPNEQPLLIAAHEVSGTIAIFRILTE
ncbi:MAG: choice-of-anchor I family protein [Geminicoccaceae bacterium]